MGNLSALAVGRARYTMICDEDGGILDDLIVYRTGEQTYMVVANAANAQVVLDALRERQRRLRRAVRDDRDAYALIAVQGPEAAGILKGLTDADLDGLKYYAGLPGTVAGRDGPHRPYGIHRRGRLRAVRRARRRRRRLGGADRGGTRRRAGAVRAELPRHAAPGGGHAAVRARTDHADRRRSTRGSAGS